MTRLSPLEVATGIVFGGPVGRAPLRSDLSPAAALERAVLPALRRGACFVSFSGGRDSSAVLAVAAAVARREGLSAPVPITIRAAGVPETHETEWQERVVSHLGLADWVRLDADDDLDAIGPYATRALRRHGLLWPFNAHFHAPMLECAAGGTLLTGIGGDELWGASRRPTRRRRRRVLDRAPYLLRRAVLARNVRLDFPWLRPRAVRAARLALAGDYAREPWSAARRLSHTRRSRYLAVGTAALERLAADAGAAIAHPLLDRGVWGAVAAAAPGSGFERADAALAAAAGRALPADNIARRTKASFDAVFFASHARRFAQDWDGTGVPLDVVDPAALRAHWLGPAPDPHSLTLLQAAWLASGRDRLEQPLGGLRQ